MSYPSTESLLLDNILSGKRTVDEVTKTYLAEFQKKSTSNKSIQKKETKAISPYAGLLAQLDNEEEVLAMSNSLLVNTTTMEQKKGVSEVVLVKEMYHRTHGFSIINVDGAYYIGMIEKNSPASVAQLRFGDQIVRINSLELTGMPTKTVMSRIKYFTSAQTINLIVRDRPLHRVFNMVKNSEGYLGFGLSNGVIVRVSANGSAARNGVPHSHKLVEINSQNVLGLTDPELIMILNQSARSVSIGIIPYGFYNRLVKGLSNKQLRNDMCHDVITI